ncbi:MAG: ABC transporter permease, partial [Ruminococcus sp.]|nr:ABC transporter permease [Ruminococcus sp.]
MLVQTDADDPYVVYQSANAFSTDYMYYSIDNGRQFAYSYTMGLGQRIWEKYDGNTPSNIEKAIENGDTIKDFYSQFIMPLLTVMIFVIIILSVVGLTRNIIKDKQENFAVLRSLGLEKRHLIGYIFCDFTVTALICIGIGLGLGSAAHIGLINFLNGAFDLKLNYGFDCVKYVNEVTYNPYLLSVVTILICVEVSVLIATFSFRRKTPVQMFAQGRAKRRRWHRAKPAGRYRSWIFLLIRRIKLRNVRIAVVSVIVMSVALTGYTYFQAFADRQNNDLYWEKKNSGLDYWDYSAKTGDGNRYLFGIENHHENGVTVSDYQKLKEQDFVDDSFALAAVSSTRLSFAQGALDDKAQRDFKKFELKKYADTDTENAHEFDIAQKESEEAMIEKIGYDKTDLIYACPSVALFDDALDELDKFVVDGKIDKQKLKDGSEVLLVMDITNKIKFEKTFKAGDKLPLSDVVLNEKEEKIDFNNLNVDELGEPAYQKKVKNYEGNETEERSYAIGKRKDINVKIGAVLILDLDVAHKYMAEAAGGDCGLNVFCAPESFKAWGVGERNLSQVYMKLTGESQITKADVY